MAVGRTGLAGRQFAWTPLGTNITRLKKAKTLGGKKKVCPKNWIDLKTLKKKKNGGNKWISLESLSQSVETWTM